MAITAIRKLDLEVGELLEIDGRRYEVVSTRTGRLTLEPAVITMDELDRKHGTKPASREEFDRLFGDLPRDGEG